MNSLSKKIDFIIATSLCLCLCSMAFGATTKSIDLPNFIVPVSHSPVSTIELPASGDTLYGFEDQKFCDRGGYQTCGGSATVRLENGDLQFGQTGDTATQIIELGQDGVDLNFKTISATEIKRLDGQFTGKILLPDEKRTIDHSVLLNLLIIRSASADFYTGAKQMRTCSYKGENTLSSSRIKPGNVYLVRTYSYFYWKNAAPSTEQYNDTVTKIKILSVNASGVKIAYQVLAELWPSPKAAPRSSFQPFSITPNYIGELIFDDSPRVFFEQKLYAEVMLDKDILSFDRSGVLDCNATVNSSRPSNWEKYSYALKMEIRK